MGYPDWPLFDLRLRTAALVLRPITDADLSTVADLMPGDLELDPAATTYPGLTADANRRVILYQSYWRAVLAVAFGPLAAEAAITSAWHDNHASLGVSRALGYRPNGESLHRRGDAVDVMTHLRLRRADWPGPGDVEIEGFEACRALFGS